jgi:hypothetical protein
MRLADHAAEVCACVQNCILYIVCACAWVVCGSLSDEP